VEGTRVSTFSEHAPYAAHVVAVEMFFQIALAAGLIGTNRSSNRADMAYLFYLPFSNVFVSSDNLHRRCAPHFLREDQSFVWGPDLKASLQRLVEHYAGFGDQIAEEGLHRFAPAPPPNNPECLVSQLWDRHMNASWRNIHKNRISREAMQDPELVRHINNFVRAPGIPPEQVDWEPGEAEAMCLQRVIRKRKGSFWQAPKDLPDARESSE
jgi:hypothetical protein